MLDDGSVEDLLNDELFENIEDYLDSVRERGSEILEPLEQRSDRYGFARDMIGSGEFYHENIEIDYIERFDTEGLYKPDNYL